MLISMMLSIWTDFHEIWYEHYAIAGYPNHVVFTFLVMHLILRDSDVQTNGHFTCYGYCS
jgi:hypothetical protein